MSGKFWIVGNNFDINKVSFSAPIDIGNKYVRYNVRYLYDNGTVKNISLTTNTKDSLILCYGVRNETGQYAKENMHQSTMVIDENTMDFYGCIVDIIKKFKNDIIPDGELKCPVKELDNGTVKLYTKLIESNKGEIFTVFQDKNGKDIKIDDLDTSFQCRPSISINFVVDRSMKASMKLQINRMFVSDLVEKIDVNLSEMD
ncbi:hypothetical protein G6F27_012812 [Rhizopus arrhizus]|nr:hypothetical protein G6F27_012812 [Rhizopus arrhizus]